ncbi:dihydropyrimidinase [Maledivibacter halophilus]|uniref:D-hydantoinase n=1 Tax=Maledivibacter halophilus TaxID=36842 RepID=A0A1T5M9A1_9FIRM|nr:dihydropyrimidinase [Maledivibacter halophilus]SKC84807.1 dihydropyrimidinase [Maledivibacter halophilus]
MSTLIKNGIIATASDVFKGDLYIESGIIKEIGLKLEKSRCHVIDAEGKYIIPGGVDVHTHLNLDVGIGVSNDDFYTGTVAAACGGTTTIVDHMGFGPKGCNLHHQVKVYHEYAKNNAVIDYGFHGVIQHINDDILKEMKDIIEIEGIPSFKIYLTYDFKLSDEEAIKTLLRLKKLGGLTTVHAENHYMIKYLKKKFIDNRKIQPIYHALSRPEESEAEAISRIIHLAYVSDNAPLYIVHLSTKLGLDYIKRAQETGCNVYAETCPQYLLLDEEKYNLPNNEGLKYIMSPPIRKKHNQKALWKGIRDGNIQVIATDHCPFSFYREKQMGREDFTKCPNGIPGVETRIPLIFSEGVMKNRIDINKFVEVTSTAPSKIFGLYPKKGTIAVGSDADIVLIDTKKEVVLTKKILHENVDYTCYEGMKLVGYPILTMVRGKIVVKNHDFVGEKGYGEFICRRKNIS